MDQNEEKFDEKSVDYQSDRKKEPKEISNSQICKRTGIKRRRKEGDKLMKKQKTESKSGRIL